FDYGLQNVQMSFGGTSGKEQVFAGGLTVKYLYGRLVYLTRDDVEMNFHDFVDDKVKGFSTDLGFAYKGQATRIGLAFYDLVNGLYWQTESNKTLTRRGAFGVQVGEDDLRMLAGAITTLEKDPITTYHFGIIKEVSLQGKTQDKQTIGFRAGAYSDKFDRSDDITYSFGTGYNYKTFRIDFSVAGPGLDLSKSRYLASISLSM
ncbi:MAG TPA: hypothetical protein PKK33_03890, partial [Candidatus Cloacimonadota bacterium]|nr:hypothetical protein [Candidatus Cloacimonadota bacterium]